MAITLAEANRMVQAAVAKADELSVKVSIAVCDAGGNLLAFNRMQGASAVSATVAQGKSSVGRPDRWGERYSTASIVLAPWTGPRRTPIHHRIHGEYFRIPA